MKTIFLLIIFFILLKLFNTNKEFFGSVVSCKSCINSKIIKKNFKKNFKKKKFCSLVLLNRATNWVNYARKNGCNNQCNLRWTTNIANGVKNYLKNPSRCR